MADIVADWRFRSCRVEKKSIENSRKIVAKRCVKIVSLISMKLVKLDPDHCGCRYHVIVISIEESFETRQPLQVIFHIFLESSLRIFQFCC